MTRLLCALVLLLGSLAALARPAPAGADPQSPPTRVTGGGWLAVFIDPSDPAPDPERGTFSFDVMQDRAGPTPPPIRGTLEYHDQATGFRFHSSAIAVLEADERSARFSGIGTVQGTGEAAAFAVEVTEGTGETPATFAIEVVAGDQVYEAGGDVRGGHIQVKFSPPPEPE